MGGPTLSMRQLRELYQTLDRHSLLLKTEHLLLWIRFAIPQVVLPIWCDTYDFANRVEYLGVGIWANKTVAPHVEADEFSQAVMTVLDEGENGKRRRVRARELGEVCGKAGGRRRACAKILELI